MRKAQILAESLRTYQLRQAVSSTERKAIETGQAIASRCGIDLSTDAALNEQGLDSVPFIPDRATFLARVHDHFQFPERAVLGNEPARHAADRLEAAVHRHSQTGDSPVVLVSHGRVLASYLARLSGDDPWGIWESMTMPDAFLAVLDSPGRVRHLGGP